MSSSLLHPSTYSDENGTAAFVIMSQLYMYIYGTNIYGTKGDNDVYRSIVSLFKTNPETVIELFGDAHTSNDIHTQIKNALEKYKVQVYYFGILKDSGVYHNSV
jgi:hypothetical protein